MDKTNNEDKEKSTSKRLRALQEMECSVACATLAMSGAGSLAVGLIAAILAMVRLIDVQLFWIGVTLMLLGTGLLWAWKHFFWNPFLHQLEDLT